jgi:hypothetical protein
MFPGHSVVEYKGKFYDAENPEGVSDIHMLSYNKRMKAASMGDEDALEILNNLPFRYDPRNPY